MNKISVIIPTRNRAKKLSDCLYSLSKQTIKPYEVVVCNNASKDSTQFIVQKFTKKLNIKYVYEKNIGISSTRNTAIESSSGEIIAFLDDDCTAHKNWVEKIVKNKHFLKKYFIIGMNFNKNYGNIFSDYVHFSSLLSMIKNIEFNKNKKIAKNYLDTKNAIVSKKQLDELDYLFDKRIDKLIYGGDIELGIRLNNLGYSGIFVKEISVTHDYIKKIFPFLKKRFFAGRGIIGNKDLFNNSLNKIESIFGKNEQNRIVKSENKKHIEFLNTSIKNYIKKYSLYKKMTIYSIFKIDMLSVKHGILYQRIVNNFKR